MADRKLQYVIEMIADDSSLRKQMKGWDWEDIMGKNGKDFGDYIADDVKNGRDAIKNAFNGLNIDWTQILGTKEIGQLEQALARSLQKNKRHIEEFAREGDASGIQATVDVIAELGKEFKNLGSTFDAGQIARSMGSLMKALSSDKISKLVVNTENLTTTFENLFSGRMLKGADRAINNIATAMASLGVDKSVVTNMKQVRSEMDKIVKDSKTITLDIDYNNLSEDKLIAALQTKFKNKTTDLSKLLGYEWGNLTMNMPEATNVEKTKKHLLAILELEKKIVSIDGKSPVDDFFAEDTGYDSLEDLRKEFKRLNQEAKASTKETIDTFKQGVKDIEKSISEKLGKLSEVKVNLTLDEANKTQFKNSINTFIEDLNAQKYGEIKSVKIALDPNEPEKTTNRGRPKSASKEQIEATRKDIQQALEAAKKEYDELDNILNNSETGLRKQSEKSPENKHLVNSISKAEEGLKALEKTMTSYNYLLSHMDDYDFAKSIVSDWKKFSSAAQNIRISQDKLLTDTRKWRTEMNDALKFKYQWTVEGAEEEFDRLSWALTDISERKPIQLVPDIDFMVEAIQKGLSGREINVQLTSDSPIKATGGVVGNLGFTPVITSNRPVAPIVSASKPVAVVSQPQPQPQPPKESTTKSQAHVYIDTATDTIIDFVERQINSATELKSLYAELLKDAEITDKQVTAYLQNVRDKKTVIPENIVSKYGSAEIFLQKLKKTKEQVNFNDKLPFLNVTKDILGLKDTIVNNPEDEEQVRKASEQIKALLIKSVVDAFKTYNQKSKERFARNQKEIQSWEKTKESAIQAYSSNAEKKKRLEKIDTQKRKVAELESNTAIAEYADIKQLIQMAKDEGDATALEHFLKQERETLPAVKQGYQDLIDAKEQLQALYKEDPKDTNLLKIVEAEQKIASLTRSNTKITRSRQEYESIGVPLNELESLINAGNSRGIYNLIVDKILSKPNVVQSMGSKRTTSDAVDPMYLFDTTYQKLMTATIDMVQKALSISQKATEELDRRAGNEGLLRDVQSTAIKKKTLSTIWNASSPLSKETFAQLKQLFVGDVEHARAVMGDKNQIASDRDKAYINFAQAANRAAKAADAFRGIFDSWSTEDRISFTQAENKQEWFKQYYHDDKTAQANYDAYIENDEALQALKASISSKTSDGKEQYSITNEITDQLKGYVFRVTLVDDKGTHTIGVGTQKLVEGGKLNKPDKSYKAGSIPMSDFLIGLPEDFSQIAGIEFFKAPGGRRTYDQPSIVENPVVPRADKPDNSRTVAEAKRTIAAVNRMVDVGENVVPVQEELAVATESLQTAEGALEDITKRINNITGGIDSKEYRENLIHQRNTLESASSDGSQSNVKQTQSITNKAFDEAGEIIATAIKTADIAQRIANNPLDTEAQKLFKGNLPNGLQRLSEIVTEKESLNRIFPQSQEQAIEIQTKLQALFEEERNIQQSIKQWANDVVKNRDNAIESANKMKEQAAPGLAKAYQNKLVGLVDQAMSLSQQLETDPNNEELKTQMQGIVDTVSKLVVYYKDLLNKYNLTTKGFLGNESERKYQNALQLYQRPGDEHLLASMELWGGLGKIPEAVYNRNELAQKESELMRLIPTLPEDQRKVMEAERIRIASEYRKENAKVLKWVNSKQGGIGTGILAGLGNSGQKFKATQDLMSLWRTNVTESEPKVDAGQERARINDEISTLNTLNQQRETQEQIVANARERVALATRQLEIERELADVNITAERKSELETELANNKARATQLGARTKKFATTSVDSEQLQNAYIEVVNDLINQQEESDTKIRNLSSEIEREKERIGRLKAERTPDAVEGGRRRTQDTAINSQIKTLAEEMVNKGVEARQEQERLKLLISQLENQIMVEKSGRDVHLQGKVTGYQEGWGASQFEAYTKTQSFAQVEDFDFETWLHDRYDFLNRSLESFAENPNDLLNVSSLKRLVVVSKSLEELTGQEWLKPFVAKNSMVFHGATDPYEAISSFIQSVTEQQNEKIVSLENELNTNKGILQKVHAPRGFAQIYKEAEEEHPIVDYYDYQNPYEHQQQAIRYALEQKAKDYVREHMTSEQQQQAINKAIIAQETAIKEKEAQLQAERAHNKAIVEERNKLKTEGQVTDEMIAARRNVTEEVRREAQILRTSVDVVEATTSAVETAVAPLVEDEPYTSSDAHYQNYTSGQMYQYGGGGIYNINISELAKDTTLHTTNETLNSIYTLLSGDTSRAGLSDSERRALEAEREVIRSQLSGGLGRNDEKQLKMFSAWARLQGDPDAKWQQMDGEAESAEAWAKKLRRNGYTVGFAASEEDWDTESEKYNKKILEQREKAKIRREVNKKIADDKQTAELSTHLYNQFAGWLRQIGREVFNITDLPMDKFANVIQDIWIPTALDNGKTDISQLTMDTTSGQYLIENRLGIKAPEPEIAPTDIQEVKETSESLMTIGKAINIINKAIGESTAKTPTGMAKAYANKIHANSEAAEAAKFLYNTPDGELTSKFGLNTKNKLKDFHSAWLSKQQADKPKVAVEPTIESGKVAEEVRENITETPAQAPVEPSAARRTLPDGSPFEGTEQEYNELMALLGNDNVEVRMEPTVQPGAVGQVIDEDIVNNPPDSSIISTTLPDGSPFEGTEQEYNELMAWLSGESVEVDVKPTVQPHAVDRAIDEDVANNPPDASIIRTTLPDGSPFEGTEQEFHAMLAMLDESMETAVDTSNQQLHNEQRRSEETEEQLTNEKAETTESTQQFDNTASLKAREEEINAKLLADDKLKAAQNASQTANGGIIGAMNELAKDTTLREILTAIGEIAKRQVSSVSGKGNSAQDLLMRIEGLRDISKKQNRERVAYIDLNTGAITDSLEGKRGDIDNDTLDALRQAYRGAIDLNAQLHTHGDSDNPEDQYFSAKDFEAFKADFDKGIKKQILVSMQGLSVLDLSDVQDLSKDTLTKFGGGKSAYEALLNNDFGARYVTQAWNSITPQSLVKLLGIKGIESKYTETETRESARKGVLAEDAKEAADILQESTGRAIKKTVERVGLELETLTEKTDTKGNKTWSSQINNKFGKAMQATNKEIESHKLDEQFGVGTKASVALKEYRDTYKQLTDYVNQFNNSTSDTEKAGLQKQINDLIPVFNKAEKELIDLIARKEQFLRVGEKLGDVLNQDSIGKGSLEAIATREFFGDGLTAGQNIATAGTQSTKNGRQLLVDVLDHGTISRYGIEVDEVTGQVRKLTLAEGDLANAFQNVNRAMKQDKAVQASVAIGEDATQMQQFLNTASSPAWDTYKTSLQEMQDYTARLWNTMKAGERVSQEELDYLMALSERVITLGKNVQKTSIDFKNFWTQNPDNVFGIDKISYDPDNKDARVREELEKRARVYANASNAEYNFSSFDNDTLQFTLTDAEGKISKVTYLWNELYNQIAMVSDKSTSALDPMVAKINRYDEAIQQAVKDGYLMYEDSNFNAFYEATDGIRFLVNGIEQGYETFDTVKDKLYELRQEALKYGEQAKKTIAQNKRLFAGTGAKKQVDNQYNKIFGTAQAGDLGFDLEATDNPEILKQYINAYNQLNTDYQKYVDNHNLNDPKIQQQIQQQAAKVQLLGRRFLSSITQAEKLKGLVEQSGTFRDRRSGMERDLGGTIGVSAEEVKNLEAKMRDFVENGLGQANIEGVKFDAVNQRLTYSFRTSQRSVADMVIQYNEATKALYAYQKQERESLTGLPGFMNSMKAKMKSILQYTASITSIYRVWGELRRGVQYIREIDSALTELKKVTDETEKTYDRFLQTAAKTADKVGSTIKEVVSSTADFARLGYNLQDAARMAESAQVLMNVSEFTDISTATDTLISAIQAFSYTADESLHVVDIMNTIGNRYAISTADLASSLTRSSAALVAAGNNMEEAVALTAAANTIIQDADSVGNALKTVSMRIRGTSVEEMAEAGEDTDGLVTSKSKLHSKIKALTAVSGKEGISILGDDGKYLNTYEILTKIAERWEEITKVGNDAPLLELIAGKTRGSVVAALLQQPEILKDAYNDAMNAEGSALEENERYLDSIQGRIDLFNNSIQTMWSNTLNSSVVKGIVDIGTGLIKIVDSLGLIKTLVFAIGTYLIQKNFKGDLFGGLLPQKDEAYDVLENKLTSLQNKRQSLIDDFQNSQAYEDFLGKRMAAGYDDAARAIDKVRIKNEQLKGQIQQLDTEIVNTKLQMDTLGTSGLTVGQRIKAGFSKAKTAVAQFGKELIKSMAWSMAITAVLESLTIIGGWLKDAWNVLKPKSFEDLQEALEQTESELSNVESEIRSLESELDDANERIEELQSQGSLSFIEQEELSKLKSATAELEAQIALKKTLQQTLQDQANGQAIEANEAYLDTSFMSDKSRTEKQEEWGENVEEIGKVAGTAMGATAAAVIGAKVTGAIGTFFAGPAGTAVGIALGSAIGGVIGHFAGEGLAGASYDSEQTVGEAMDNMVAERNRLKAEQDKALAEKDVEAYNAATEALRTYDNQMAKHISQIQENYNAMDWETANPDDKKKMIEYADWLSKYSIEMGTEGAKSAAIERIFGAEADDSLKSAKKKIEDAVKSGQDINLDDILSEEEFIKLMQRLTAVGAGAGDVALYFKDAYQSEVDAMNDTSTENAVQEVANLTSGIKALKDAFNEFRTEGKMTAETLIGLKDIFGETEGWDEFITTVSTGTATLDQMTEKAQELAENYVNNIIKPDNWNPDEYLTYISYLESLGVQDAQKFLDAKLTQAAVEAFVNGTYATIEEAAEAYSNEDHKVEVPQELVDAAEAKKTAEDKATTTSGNKTAYENQKSLYDTAQANKKIYNIQKEYLEGMGVSVDNITDAFKQGLTAQQVFDTTVSQMPDSFKTLYENARKAYEDGNTEQFEQYKLQLEDYGVYTEYITSAFKNGVNASDIWANSRAMTESFETAYNQMKDLYANGVTENLPTITVPVTTESDVARADAEAKEAASVYQQALDKYGLVLDIQLFEVNDLIDDLQNVYDTLTSAAKEYSKNGGYVSVDTLQTLLGLDAKYIGLLYDEQGQLNLNTESIQRMTQARVMEMAVVEAKSYLTDLESAAMAGNIESIAGLVKATSIATDTEWGFVDAKLASIQATMIANGVSAEAAQQYTEQARHNIASIKKLAEQTNANIQNAISSSGNNAKDNTNEALEQLQKQYERQIKNLDNQQTYIQNRIDYLEAKDEAVSKSYYEQQIGLEEKKLALYKQERDALLKLDMTDEVADALWEVEHAIQESTMRMVEFRQSIIDLYKTAFDDIVGAYDNKDSFLSDQQEYIEKYRELLELQKNPESASGYQEQIQLEKDKMQDNIAELTALESALADAMTYGGLERGSEEWIEMQEQIRATEAAILDNKIAIEQYKEELKNIPVEAFNSVRDAFSFQDDILTSQQDYIQGYADHLEALGIDVPQELYDELIAIEQDKRANTLANLVDARQGFDDIQAQGFTAADEEWQDAYNQLVELEKKIQDSDTAIAEWQKTIRELDFEKFERFISRLDDIDSEIDHLRGLFDDEDVAFEDGTWTKEGITSLGLLYHQMQLNQEKSQEYAQEIEKLNEEYDNGSMSEQEYYEQLQELKDGQWEAIESYEDAKDAIVDMEEARIDMIEEGINKEIEAYEELIDLKREELDAERDLYNFKKDTEEQTKNIAELQRKIASLSGSDDASDIAARRQLEAELRDAQTELDDSYYNHAMDSQADALDNELEAYKKGKDDYLEMLRETLDGTQAIINAKIAEVLSNADTVLTTIDTTAGEHEVTLSTALKQPWIDASATATAFKTGLDETLPLMTNEDGVITVFNSQAKALLEGVFNAGGTAAGNFKTAVDTQLALIKTAVETSSSELTSKIQFPWTDTTKEDGPIATFSTKAKGAVGDAVTKAQTNAETMKSYLSSPWTNATTAVNTFSTTVADALDDNLEKVKQNVKDINAEAAKVNLSYVGSDNSDDSGDNPGGNQTYRVSASVAIGNKTLTASKVNKDKNKAKTEATNALATQFHTYFQNKGRSDEQIEKLWEKTYLKRVQYHAKGTLGTKRDEFAITDESWIGEEITLAAGKNGQLQYLKKGSAVMPADISANLVEWGKLNPNMMQVGGGANINLISNAVSKPEFSLDIENFLRCDNVSQDTMPELKRFVNEQMNNLMKQMNYAIKRRS